MNRSIVPSRKSRRTGSALITALAVSAVSVVMLVGITRLAVSHSIRQQREADYERALQVAEAGLNYEIQYISTHLSGSPNAHTSPTTSSLMNGTTKLGDYTVWVTKTDGTSGWSLPNDVKIWSTGTVGTGTSKTVRTVSCICKTSGGSGGQSIFDPQYAVFAYKRLLFRNSSNAINGNMGVNGPAYSGGYNADVENNGVGNANASGKPLTLAGGATLVPGNKINPNFTNNPGNINQPASNVTWPTVDTIVASQFANGWSTLSSAANVSAQWGRIRMYRTQSRTMTPAGTKPLNTVSTSSTVLNNNVVKTYAEDGQPTNCIILTPGDYYFTQVQLDSNGFSGPAPIIYIDCNAVTTGGTPGPVRIWVGGSVAADDYFKSEIRYTSSVSSEKAQLSRIFYGKNRTLSFNGNGIYSGVYAVRAAAALSGGATISLDQSAKFWGTIIADYVTLQGGVDINYVTGIANAMDYTTGGGVGAYYFASDWKEEKWKDTTATTKGATVFPDGTDR